MHLEFNELDHDERSTICDNLWNRQYYALIGSGTSLDSYNTSGIKLRSAEQLRNTLSELNDLPITTQLQQAYSLLNEDDVLKYITNGYFCQEAGPTAKLICRYPWKRIFTLNVDNCLEMAHLENCAQFDQESRDIEIINFCDDFRDTRPDTIQSIVHLHGSVERSIDGYIFSHLEYAKNMSRPNSWMLTLSQLIKSEPFIIMGTQISEIDLGHVDKLLIQTRTAAI